jgi:hypothetical protein
MSSDKQQILETITAVSRLITLAFKPSGTKISIRNHNVVLCEPSTSKYYGLKIPQGVDRYLNNDSRDDIYVLNKVICNFIEWYILPYKKEDQEIHRGLINMARYLCVGLKKLQKTYGTGTTVGNLQYYIIVLTSVINGSFTSDMLYNSSNIGRKSFLDESISTNEDELMYSTIFDVDKFKSFWTKEELKTLYTLFNECFKEHDEPDNAVFSCSSDMPTENNENMEGIHSNENINVSTISVVSNKNKVMLPVPRSQANVIVKGQLIAIINILETMDKRFREMIDQSVKGKN